MFSLESTRVFEHNLTLESETYVIKSNELCWRKVYEGGWIPNKWLIIIIIIIIMIIIIITIIIISGPRDLWDPRPVKPTTSLMFNCPQTEVNGHPARLWWLYRQQLTLHISSYPNSLRCWVGTDLIQWSKIASRPVVEPTPTNDCSNN